MGLGVVSCQLSDFSFQSSDFSWQLSEGGSVAVGAAGGCCGGWVVKVSKVFKVLTTTDN